MKATELRVGNYFDLYGQVAQMIPNDFEKWFDAKWECDAFKPIPLAEEWLIKLGFDKHRNHDYYFRGCGEYEIRCVINAFSGGLDSESVWFASIQTGYGSQPVSLTKKYVHELQNLYYALTGEEL